MMICDYNSTIPGEVLICDDIVTELDQALYSVSRYCIDAVTILGQALDCVDTMLLRSSVVLIVTKM